MFATARNSGSSLLPFSSRAKLISRVLRATPLFRKISCWACSISAGRHRLDQRAVIVRSNPNSHLIGGHQNTPHQQQCIGNQPNLYPNQLSQDDLSFTFGETGTHISGVPGKPQTPESRACSSRSWAEGKGEVSTAGNDDQSPLIDPIECIVCNHAMKLEKSSPDAEGSDIIQYRCGLCNRIELVRLLRRSRDSMD
jgi:hypothetical protein